MNSYTFPQTSFAAERLLLHPEHLRPDQAHTHVLSYGTYDAHTCKKSYNDEVTLQAFYVPNKDRPNLKVLINATAHRLNTQSSGNGKLSAVGVEFEYDGKRHTVNAQKDVCLTAG